MKSLLLAWRIAVRSWAARHIAAARLKILAVLYSRPGLKRGLLTLLLFAPLALMFTFVFNVLAAVMWGLVVAAVFLGLGAERASTDWDEFFALPALRNFAFWRWHPLERKRYFSVLATLIASVLCLLVWEVLS